MIVFDNWKLTNTGPLAMQYDHGSRAVFVKDVPEGYDWNLLVRCGDRFDTMALSPMDGGVGQVLTRDQLSLSGYYSLQLVGTLRSDGVTQRHTNVVQAYVGKSLSGDANWPTVPSAFRQVEDNIRELNAHPPVPGEDGNWLVWDLDTHSYVPSAFPLPEMPVGPAGPAGPAPQRGVDYWTAEDQQAIVADVLAALPNGDEVSY